MNKYDIMKEIEKLDYEDLRELKDWISKKVMKELDKKLKESFRQLRRCYER